MLLTTDLRRHFECLLNWLMHDPEREKVQKIISVIENISGPQVIWRDVKRAINRVVRNNKWDTAMLIASALDSSVNEHLRLTLKALKITILNDPDERNVAKAVFQDSQLKSVLETRDSTQCQKITARKEFMIELVNALTTVLLVHRKQDLYRIARSKAATLSWLPSQCDDYFNEAYITLRGQFAYIVPQSISGYMVTIMKNEMIKSMDPYNKIEFLPPLGEGNSVRKEMQ